MRDEGGGGFNKLVDKMAFYQGSKFSIELQGNAPFLKIASLCVDWSVLH